MVFFKKGNASPEIINASSKSSSSTVSNPSPLSATTKVTATSTTNAMEKKRSHFSVLAPPPPSSSSSSSLQQKHHSHSHSVPVSKRSSILSLPLASGSDIDVFLYEIEKSVQRYRDIIDILEMKYKQGKRNVVLRSIASILGGGSGGRRASGMNSSSNIINGANTTTTTTTSSNGSKWSTITSVSTSGGPQKSSHHQQSSSFASGVASPTSTTTTTTISSTSQDHHPSSLVPKGMMNPATIDEEIIALLRERDAIKTSFIARKQAVRSLIILLRRSVTDGGVGVSVNDTTTTTSYTKNKPNKRSNPFFTPSSSSSPSPLSPSATSNHISFLILQKEATLADLQAEFRQCDADFKALDVATQRNVLFGTTTSGATTTSSSPSHAPLLNGSLPTSTKDLRNDDFLQGAISTQDETTSKLKESLMTITIASSVGMETAAQLQGDREKMARIDTGLDKIDSELGIARGYLSRIMKRLYTDKIFIGLATVLLLGLVSIIVYVCIHPNQSTFKIPESVIPPSLRGSGSGGSGGGGGTSGSSGPTVKGAGGGGFMTASIHASPSSSFSRPPPSPVGGGIGGGGGYWPAQPSSTPFLPLRPSASPYSYYYPYPVPSPK